MRLVLASASPRRAELLRTAGFTFDAVPAEVDERVRGGESPGDYVRRLAAEKSSAVLAAVTSSLRLKPHAASDVIVLGADTAVIVDGEVLVADGRLVRWDEREIAAEAEAALRATLERL